MENYLGTRRPLGDLPPLPDISSFKTLKYADSFLVPFWTYSLKASNSLFLSSYARTPPKKWKNYAGSGGFSHSVPFFHSVIRLYGKLDVKTKLNEVQKDTYKIAKQCRNCSMA